MADGVNTVAVTAGASAPEVLVKDVVDFFKEKGMARSMRWK